MTGMEAFIARWQSLPRWALIGGLVVIGGVSYLIYKKVSSTSSDTATWQSSARTYLTSQGYSYTDASDAVNAYATGQSLTPTQVSLIAAAIGAVGTPDSIQINSAVTAQLANTPSTGPGLLGSAGAGSEGNAGGGTSLPGSPYPSNGGQVASSSTYWNVPVAASGWSTTFYGIASQFSLEPTTVSHANPGLAYSVWAKLPQGSIVKVPRPSDD